MVTTLCVSTGGINTRYNKTYFYVHIIGTSYRVIIVHVINIRKRKKKKKKNSSSEGTNPR